MMIEWEWCQVCQDTTPHEHYFENGIYKERCTKCGEVNQ